MVAHVFALMALMADGIPAVENVAVDDCSETSPGGLVYLAADTKAETGRCGKTIRMMAGFEIVQVAAAAHVVNTLAAVAGNNIAAASLVGGAKGTVGRIPLVEVGRQWAKSDDARHFVFVVAG